uniref:Uncharacterized protein n=1 Tax=Oryza brachyantha TaxID=4533 RepID=J3LYA6_ORYBR
FTRTWFQLLSLVSAYHRFEHPWFQTLVKVRASCFPDLNRFETITLKQIRIPIPLSL